MICKWTNGWHVFEFDVDTRVKGIQMDVDTRAEEIQRVRAFAKEHGLKFSEMVREDK